MAHKAKMFKEKVCCPCSGLVLYDSSNSASSQSTSSSRRTKGSSLGEGSRAQTGPGTGGPQSSPSKPRWLRDSSSLETLRSQCASFKRPSCPCAVLPGPQETVQS